MRTVVLFCACASKYQDGRYGEGKRVHNTLAYNPKLGSAPQYRCTVCARVKGA